MAEQNFRPEHLNPSEPADAVSDSEPLLQDLDYGSQTNLTHSTPSPEEEQAPGSPPAGTQNITRKLYISHFLSMWNSRMFEFGAVLFLVSAFPGTLLFTSIYALVRSLAVVLFSSMLGRLIDRFDRLKVLRASIVWQRLPVVGSCLILLVLVSKTGPGLLSYILFGCVSILACLEKLASVANTVSVERDWVVIIAESLAIPRQDLNASMRRIDLFCKLIAPLFISVIDSYSTKVAIWTVFGLSSVWVVVEYLAIAQVYNSIPELKKRPTTTISNNNTQNHPEANKPLSPWHAYISSPIFLASFSLSLLYLTVLSFSPQMITYLLSTGFTSLQISYMRIGAVLSELLGTWAAPLAMRRVGPIRAGLWSINWQFGSLAAAAAGFLVFDDPSKSKLVATVLVVGVAVSRVGLWGFDLNVQYLVQEETTPNQRAQFSSTEMAVQSIFELLSFTSTIVFSRPDQFKYPVLISYGAIGTAAVLYAAYVRKVRGHLVHVSRCLGGKQVPTISTDRRGYGGLV
ncbi:hypothetical protein BGW36DRAFT_12718 [Talaromyces proteolyticus]|uniref:Solute carrier family 40 member n=1 Tax=Talaromyces proteolyticus TaxID=1131652 RepID=A0AAD4L2F7_9EURO|nr:uncharacterized protein BGW36DRAFT_12718 [Talaromyces proteolyticus]KAH8705396.1 hypothetical protein BGW36DRAFT_12718 [Talaromyces proteolyticus]